MGGDPAGIRTGGCAAWALPPDGTCPSVARFLAGRALTGLGLPENLVYQMVTAVSELSTNALQHGLGLGREPGRVDRPAGHGPELWIYHRLFPVSQLVLKVFDSRREWIEQAAPAAGPVDTGAEHGRGLAIVHGYFGNWFAHLTRARVNPWAIPGKAVAFSVPITGLCPPPRHPGRSSVQAAGELHARLARRGIDGVITRTCGGVAVVSVDAELNVWCRPNSTFRWRADGGGEIVRTFEDLEDVTEEVLRRHEEPGHPTQR
jgi:hypothetical protein